MKTAEEIYEELYGSKMIGATGALNSAFKEMCCKVAKVYANQKIDEAAEKALVMHVEQDGDPICTIDMYCVEGCVDYNGKPTYVIADKQSILNLKDEI